VIPRRDRAAKETFMADVIFMLFSIGFLAASIGLVFLFERLRGQK
jgi:hypothetical protein